jgi:hypothetical protein
MESAEGGIRARMSSYIFQCVWRVSLSPLLCFYGYVENRLCFGAATFVATWLLFGLFVKVLLHVFRIALLHGCSNRIDLLILLI